MDIPPVGELNFDGVIYEATYIGVKYINHVRCECFQPDFADCTTVRCEPIDAPENVFFIDAKDF